MHDSMPALEAPETFEPIDDGELKIKINTLIWTHGRPTLTLGEAEDVACKVHKILWNVMCRTEDRLL